MKVLVTGAAGFIGMQVSQLLLARGDAVVGLDNLKRYYDPQLKRDRLARLSPSPGFRFVRMDVADRDMLAGLGAHHQTGQRGRGAAALSRAAKRPGAPRGSGHQRGPK